MRIPSHQLVSGDVMLTCEQMTDLEKKLFLMLDDLLDGLNSPKDLVSLTGLSKERCEEIINEYWKIKEKFPY